jgi:hypothetical protein
MTVITLVDGRVVIWEPLPGLDPSLGERIMLIGATAYGRAIGDGKPEEEAQQEAERAMYSVAFSINF